MALSQDGGGHVSHGNDTAYNIMVPGQTSVTDSVTVIVAASPYRAKIQLANISTNVPAYIGTSTAVTAGDGYPLPPETTVIWPYTGALYGITGSGSAVVGFADFQS